MAKWIFNNDTKTNTYSGQQIVVGAYYEIQPLEELSFSNNSLLITDISNTKAIVSKSDDVSGHIVEINDQINYLKDDLPKEVTTKKEKGVITTKMAKGKVTLDADGKGDIDFSVPAPGRYVSGGLAWFSTFDSDSVIMVEIHHPTAGIVGSYKDEDLMMSQQGWFVEPNGTVGVQSMDFFGFVDAGLILKVVGTHGLGAAASGEILRVNLQWGKLGG